MGTGIARSRPSFAAIILRSDAAFAATTSHWNNVGVENLECSNAVFDTVVAPDTAGSRWRRTRSGGSPSGPGIDCSALALLCARLPSDRWRVEDAVEAGA